MQQSASEQWAGVDTWGSGLVAEVLEQALLWFLDFVTFLVLVSAEPALVLVELLLFAEQWWQQRVSGLLVGKLRGDGLEPEPL